MAGKKLCIIACLLLSFCFCRTGGEQEEGSSIEAPPAPVVTLILPPGIYANSQPFILFVYGSDFTEDSYIYVNGKRKTTTFSSESAMNCLIGPDDINGTSQVQQGSAYAETKSGGSVTVKVGTHWGNGRIRYSNSQRLGDRLKNPN